MTADELWAELEKMGCNVPTLKMLQLSYTELVDLVAGLQKLMDERKEINV